MQRIPSGTVLVLLVGLVVATVGMYLVVETALRGGGWGDVLKTVLLFAVMIGGLVLGARRSARHDADR